MPLPRLPGIAFDLLLDRTAASRCDEGFLRLRRLTLRARYPDGTESAPFPYDVVERTALDAVVLAAHYRDGAGARRVLLRSATRPPVALSRTPDVSPIPEREPRGQLWELPAGLVEEDERTPEGLLRCAARELDEELGLRVSPARLEPLGPSVFPTAGIIAERFYFFHVEFDPASLTRPHEDGSALERHAALADLPLEEALSLVRRGEIEDAKTEIGLRRLAEVA